MTVDRVARTGDLSNRVGASGNDELARLSQNFDAMLSSLDASVQAQRQLIADASHELRTPITSLRTNLEVLVRGDLSREDHQALIADLLGQVERLTNLVRDLIDLGRDEQLPMTIESVALADVVRDAIADVQLRYSGTRLQLEADDSVVRAIRPRLVRAIVNLLDNAAKWSPPGAPVDVVVAAGELTVRDHGPGIKPQDVPFVFDRFWRSAEARQMPGSGLGLAIVREIVRAHGGTVAVEHPGGGGALFRLRLGAPREWRYVAGKPGAVGASAR
jgi:two-component system sensor histidine kinase MprB